MRPPEKLYAEALFSLLQDEAALTGAAEALTGDPALWMVLVHPGISAKEKEAVLDCVLAASPVLLKNFFKLLCRRERIPLLPRILTAYRALRLKSENSMGAVMRCAFLPENSDLARIQTALCALHHKERVELSVRQEPALIGGFILEAEGKTYDRSVKGALRQLQSTLKAR